MLSNPSIQVEAAFSITQGDIVFVAMQVADGNDSPVVLAKLANGTWQALDHRSSAASGRAEAAGEDPGASMGSLGAQKAVSCLSSVVPSAPNLVPLAPQLDGRYRFSAMSGRGRWAMVGLAATLVVGACGGDPEPLSDRVIPLPTEAPTTSAIATTVPSFGFDPAMVQEVWADFQAASDALAVVAEDPDPDDPRLAEWLAGPLLARWQTEFGERRAAGRRAEYPHDSRHREELKGIITLGVDNAELDVCALDDAIVTGAGGEVLDDDVAIRRAVVTMQLEEGRWKWAALRADDATEAECPGFFDSSPSPTTASVMRDTTLAS